MENQLTAFSLYSGKIGLDNLLLMIVGGLYYVVYSQNKTAACADLHWRTAVFFVVYGFAFNLYRIKSLRPHLLFGSLNFQLFQSGLLLLSLMFLYDGLIHALIHAWKRKHAS